MLRNTGRRSLSTLSEPMRGVPAHASSAGTSLSYAATLETLSSGARVVSLPRKHPLVAVRVAVQAGSRFETASTAGASFFLAHAFMKSTRSQSSLRLTRTLEALAPSTQAYASRDLLLVGGVVPRESAHAYAAALADVLQPALKHWEMDDARAAVALRAAERGDDALVDELLHAAAFGGSSYGRPLVPMRNASKVPQSALEEHVANCYVAQRALLVTAGLEADEASALASDVLGALPAGTAAPAPTAYRGGERLLEMPGNNGTHFALAHSTAAADTPAVECASAKCVPLLPGISSSRSPPRYAVGAGAAVPAGSAPSTSLASALASSASRPAVTSSARCAT
eukprot:TRINITY_DN3316_c0_g1_i4.p1 TRINITY_DN3316_c0_g1~~TRINITY_DN3316_c0_g1_i4.p1  ORF type:complete len:341 (-),score=204.43 TRINITY_DN3316_c0_g1_i4:439-1461(-)